MESLNCTNICNENGCAKKNTIKNTVILFFHDVQVLSVHATESEARALKGHKGACYQVSWKPLEGKD